MNSDFDVIKNTTFIICIVITLVITVVGSWAIIRYNYEAEENERLKEIIKDNTILVKDENGNYQECNINPLDYKSRNEKAIEYIEKSMNNPQPFYEYIFGDENGKVENLDKLLNILNGGDE